MVDVELGKKETRTKGVTSMSLSEFLDVYKKDDYYMVKSASGAMRGEQSLGHGSIVLASRASGCHFGHSDPQNHPSGYSISFVRNFSKCIFKAYILIFSTQYDFHKHCMRIFCLMSISKRMFIMIVICVYCALLKNRTPKNVKIAHFGQSVCKCWLRPWHGAWINVLFSLARGWYVLHIAFICLSK